MKKIPVTALFIIFIAVAGNAQSLYSEKNLKQATPEDLNLYLKKAKSQKKAGGILLIAAPVSAATGILLSSLAYSGGSEMEFSLGLGMMFVSMGALAIGIPLRITGSSRVKKVSREWNERYNTSLVSLAPYGNYNYHTHGIQPGITLRVRF
jgi:hypothetical protein